MNQSICALGLFAALFAFGCSGDGDGGGGTGGTGNGTGGASSSSGGASSSTAGSAATDTCRLGMDTSAPSTSVVDACCLLCIKEEPCDPGTTLAHCAGVDGYRQCDELAAAPPACAGAVQAYFDCLRSEPDACAPPEPTCDDLSLAAGTACN